MLFQFNPNNLPHVYGYDGDGNLTSDTVTHPDGTVAIKTFTWTGGKLTGESPYIVQDPA